MDEKDPKKKLINPDNEDDYTDSCEIDDDSDDIAALEEEWESNREDDDGVVAFGDVVKELLDDGYDINKLFDPSWDKNI